MNRPTELAMKAAQSLGEVHPHFKNLYHETATIIDRDCLLPEAITALQDLIELVYWMSAAEAFGPDGEAEAGWKDSRPTVQAAHSVLQKMKRGD